MKKKTLAAAGLALVTAMALTACSPSSGSGGGESTETATGAAGVQIRVWLVGSDTPDAAREYLISTFEAENPGNTLVIEEQSWTGLVDKYTTALSGSDSPDVVEIGNTQAPMFTEAGFFTDLTPYYEELGGDDLLPGFVEVGSWNGTFYAAPYYSGARVVTYSTDMYDGALPTTWAEYISLSQSLSTDTVSGLYLRGKDWHDGITFVWVNGGEIAVQNADGTWDAQLSSAASLAGLQQWQDLFTQGTSHAATDQTESDLQVPFCAEEVVFLPAPSWLYWSLAAAEDAATPGCASTVGNPDKLHQFAAPGLTAGSAAPGLAGGSNIAIPANSANQELALAALRIMLSDGYQSLIAANGLVPARLSQAQYLPDTEASQAASAAAAAAKLTPASPKWADVEAQMILEDGFSLIAQGNDVATVAADMDQKIESILNG
jgi:N,N'-diacetylchitobiose transport system substrate-binding protein